MHEGCAGQMTGMLWGAAGLLIFMGVAHSYLGEKFVLPRLLALTNLPVLRPGRGYTERLIRYAWHLTSLYFWACAAILVALALKPSGDTRAIGIVLASVFFLSGMITLATGPRHPAWPLFFIAAALTAFAVW
jgi:hypothetical protein